MEWEKLRKLGEGDKDFIKVDWNDKGRVSVNGRTLKGVKVEFGQ